MNKSLAPQRQARSLKSSPHQSINQAAAAAGTAALSAPLRRRANGTAAGPRFSPFSFSSVLLLCSPKKRRHIFFTPLLLLLPSSSCIHFFIYIFPELCRFLLPILKQPPLPGLGPRCSPRGIFSCGPDSLIDRERKKRILSDSLPECQSSSH